MAKLLGIGLETKEQILQRESVNGCLPSKLSPPTSKAVLRSVPRPSSLVTFSVCKASSLDGDNTIALLPITAQCDLSLAIKGTRKAAVFPEPV